MAEAKRFSDDVMHNTAQLYNTHLLGREFILKRFYTPA